MFRTMKIKQARLDSIILDPANARRHPERNIEAIKGSLARFGQVKPIVIDKSGVVRAGNGTVEAARSLGWETINAVVMELEGPEATAYAIADNRTAELAEWDDETLAATLESLQDFDEAILDAIGFDADELAELVDSVTPDPEVHEDEVPTEVPTRCKAGDLWLLGRHRLLCGDSTRADDVARLMGGEKAGMMVTDPPYGVEYDANWRNEADRANGKPCGYRAVGKVTNDDRADWREAWALFDGDIAYVWHADSKSPLVAESLESVGFGLRNLIVWAKSNFAISRGHYHHKHEPCWYAYREGKPAQWSGDRSQTTLWEIDKPVKSETGHSTQKPVECMARPIRNHDFELVYDPFLGSGTTLIAAEQLDRRCFGMEIDPKYCDVILARWEKLTGKLAQLSPA